MKKHTIWTSEINLDDWREDIIASAFEIHEEDYVENYGEDYTEDDLYLIAKNINNSYLDAERDNLDIHIPNGIIAIADLGLWNGRHTGYKEIGTNLKDCLYANCDSAEWYVDSYGRFCSTQHHHDGTNYLIYKAWKDNISDKQKENCIDLILSGKATPTILTRYAKNIGKVIADIYGWKVR